jgi:phage baseplate assembly protein W
MAVTKQLVYKDINMSFARHPVTGNLSVLHNNEAVKRAVRNLILTNFYERPYNAEFGGNIRAMLFENITPITEQQIYRNIKRAIENFEPRAEINDIRVQSAPDQNGVNVTIVFTVINSLEPVQLDVFVERTR